MAFEGCTSITKFMQSHFTGYDDYGNPLFDRAIDSSQIALFLQTKLKDGIYYNDTAYYKVEPYNGMQVIIRQGFAQIKGKETYIPEDYILTLEPGGASMRTDRIVLQLNTNDNVRDVVIIAKKGTTELTRTSTVWELGLADITVGSNATVITGSNIKDLRLDSSVCGLVDYIYKLDTQKYFTQFEQEVNQFFSYQQQKILEFDAEYTRLHELATSLETQSFTLVNNNFDDISVKRGTTLVVEYLADGRKMETRTINHTGKVLCTRETIYTDGEKTADVHFYANAFTVDGNTVLTTDSRYTEITRYTPDGIIKEVT